MASPLRLRIPAALAVAIVGVTAPVAMSFGGCQEDLPPEPIDAGGVIDKDHLDAGTEDAGDIDAGLVDAGTPDAYVPPDPPDQ